MDAIKNNPAIVVGIVRVIALVAVVIGMPLTPEQEQALVIAIIAISGLLTIITSKFTVPKIPTTDAPAKSIQAPPAP